ncbi:CbiX/SirB N-terminal domain-containing protein [Roseitranquillus sediminis]|uniref:CbiX/SirB N-terminal domain-containing protein n=1 Tax=Roseitranquillus sediminis TaxID=2809051 RepID=UPI001D0BFFE5|nr:CbiX/SirB N-terminal domain-containing protein [Roseitranquillus sediminis]MBM9595983.1 cobalamin biosynthesis protein CbiX [Roseitranquillus sediminis]
MSAVVIVTHGQPSAPGGPEAVLAELAAEVAGHLPGVRVGSATLAGDGTLGRALVMLGPGLVSVYPLFMADGWFVSTLLPRRIAKVWDGRANILPPFGLDPAVSGLSLAAAVEGAREAGLKPSRTHLLLAAHGSPSDPRPSAAARRVAARIEAAGAFRRVSCGFVDESPFLAEAGRLDGPAICLPFFAAANGHVNEDLPEALRVADFPGPILAPVGTRPEVPALIAAAVRRRGECAA